MKRLSVVSILLAASLLVVSPVSAHELQTDGTMSAILHVTPDDNPQSGRPTPYLLEFSDTANQFALSNCDCSVAIQANGKTISTTQLTVSSDLESKDIYMFPRPADYTLVVTGQPKQGGAFQPFALKFQVHVEGSVVATQSIPPLLWLGLGLALVLGIGAAIYWLGSFKRKRSA
jgi:hypothetical protein